MPWEHDQFISAMGTARAVSALVMTLEKSPGGTPLSFAVAVPKQVPDWARQVMFGGAPELKPMLDSGFDPNSATAGGTTVLMIAAADADKVKLLLDRGAQVNAKAKTRYTALMAAAAYNSVESAKLLLDRDAEPGPSKAEPAQFGMSPTFFAIWSGNLTLAALLMDRGGDPQVPMLLGGGFFGSMRPLDVASEHYDAPMVKLLSEHRINLNEGDAMNGLTPIEWAAIMDDLPQARVVLAAGGDVNHMDKLGWTALQWAANIDHGDSEMIKFLLANGARRDLKNKEGQTALEVAKKYGYKRHAAALERVERAER